MTITVFRNGYTAVREIRRMEAEGAFEKRNYVIALTGKATTKHLFSHDSES